MDVWLGADANGPLFEIRGDVLKSVYVRVPYEAVEPTWEPTDEPVDPPEDCSLPCWKKVDGGGPCECEEDDRGTWHAGC